MTSHYIRVPPDSTGKRVAQLAYMHVGYVNRTQTITVGAVVTTTAGLSSTIVYHNATSGTTGELHLLLDGNSAESVSLNEELKINGVTVAQAAAAALPLYTQNIVNVGANDPTYGQFVDNRGAASVRFAEGSPVFDAFGNQKISDSSMIGVYEFANDPMDDLFAAETANGATITHDEVKSLVSLNVTTANGSSAIRTTNKYHFYWPAVGTEITATVGLGDAGTANNTRRWGYFDEDNGVFFELAGTTLNVVLRSKVSGSVVETRVAQSAWNVDNMDGTGLSSIVINPAKVNVYWIDLQWLGSGRVRMGVFRGDGVRATCHEFRNAGQNDYPYMQNGSLPWRVENFNTALIGTTPVLRHVCTAVRAAGKIDYTYWRWAHSHPPLAITTDNQPLMSMRSKLLYNTIKNVVNVYPEKYACHVSGTGVVRLDFAWPITLTGSSFAVDDGTTVEFDHAATAGTVDADYWQFHSVYLGSGSHMIDVVNLFNENDEGILRGAGATPAQVPFTIVASLVSGTPTVVGTLTYRELR